jgi:hypothetical protein
MQIVDIFSIVDGIVYNIVSNELIEIHVGDILEDSQGNRSKVVSVGGITNCFGNRYTLSVMLEGEAEKGTVHILKT